MEFAFCEGVLQGGFALSLKTIVGVLSFPPFYLGQEEGRRAQGATPQPASRNEN